MKNTTLLALLFALLCALFPSLGQTVPCGGEISAYVESASFLSAYPVYVPDNNTDFDCSALPSSDFIVHNTTTSLYSEGNGYSGVCERGYFALNSSGDFGLFTVTGVYVRVPSRRGGSAGGKYHYVCEGDTEFHPITQELPVTLDWALPVYSESNVTVTACLRSVYYAVCDIIEEYPPSSSPSSRLLSIWHSLF